MNAATGSTIDIGSSSVAPRSRITVRRAQARQSRQRELAKGAACSDLANQRDIKGSALG